MYDLRASGQNSSEPEAGWFDLFSKRYRKGIFTVSELANLFHKNCMIKCCVIVFLPYHHSVATTKRLVYTFDSVETANILGWVLVLLRPRVMRVDWSQQLLSHIHGLSRR
jgi:hypothetical protein